MKFHKIPALILCLAILITLMPMQAVALDLIDPEQEIKLTLSFWEGETPIVGAPFQLYLLATVDEWGELTPAPEFADYPVDLEHTDPDYCEVLASTLQGYILRDQIQPLDQGVTDENGLLLFPTGETRLVPGLYMILGTQYTQDGMVYTCDPLIHQLPKLDADQWIYELTIYTKHTSTPEEEVTTTTRKVLKIWDDEGLEDYRPESIEVQLLCDGVVYDTVTLNEENNWRHTWSELEDGHIWSVVETGISGYQVEIVLNGITFTMTNRPDFDIPTEPTEPSEPTGPSEPTEPTEPPPPPDLPETGLLWWPVPLLVAGGLFLIFCGFTFRKVRAPDEDA